MLGHYPTGVAVVTSRDAAGEPIGMVVGTFTSVSLDPPLVGFLPDRSSTTWPTIREAKRFCVNVLSSKQEGVCRAFVTKDDSRFTANSVGDAATGSPVLRDAALWVDCDLESVFEAGDHDFVIGRVRELGVPDDAGLPLLFLRGGYGAPSIASIQAEGPEFAAQLRLADRVRPEAEALAEDLGLECLVSAAVDDSVVSLAAAGIGTTPGGSDTRVGATFPLAAPFAPLFVAWESEAARRGWLDRGRRLTGIDDTALGDAEIEGVRTLGYQVTTGHDAAERFDRTVVEPDDAQRTEVLRELQERGQEPGLHRPIEEISDVTSLAAPVRSAAGEVVLSLHLIGFTGDETPERLRVCLDRLLAAAASADRLIDA